MWKYQVLFVVLFLQCIVGKENTVYQVSGVELVDLLRGFYPKDGRLKLTEVKGDRSSLSDGIYFEPEDDALSPPDEPKYLYLNGQGKKSSLDKKPDGITTGN
ncbi:uncharacterized protein LOC142972513 [Anticarsia gemmatalis]|uniref:uncharacterized protein LOC142972513 n=1 Tax=Anticarsia gemmatalis TaxID=129554 RepID=UPI003F776FBE